MKGNDGTGNIVERDEWQTPKKLFEQLNNQYNFVFDCCANKFNTKCLDWSSNFEKYENYTTHNSWMNPPFSKTKEMFKHFFKVIKRGVAIFRNDNMETKIWQDIILKNATWIFIFKGRVAYEGMKGKGSRFPSALIGFNIPQPKGLKGTLLITNLRK